MTHTPSQMPELKPCPFCGTIEYQTYQSDTGHYIHPKSRCPMSGMILTFQQWNTRAASVPSNKERAGALEALKSLVYGGGNIGNDGKDDGGHRSLHGNLLFDHWQTIERALTAPAQSEVIDKLVNVVNGFMSDTQGMIGMSQRRARAKEAIALAKQAKE